MYNSPVLFKDSLSIVDAFSSELSKRKFVMISDGPASYEAKRFIASINGDVPYEYFEISGTDYQQEVKELLSKQKMGTQLYIAGEWDHSVELFTEAVNIGFSEEEIQTFIHGPKRKHVYCMKCFDLTEVHDEKEAQCSHCEAMLEVGPFFSKVRKGYIGYPFIPN